MYEMYLIFGFRNIDDHHDHDDDDDHYDDYDDWREDHEYDHDRRILRKVAIKDPGLFTKRILL